MTYKTAIVNMDIEVDVDLDDIDEDDMVEHLESKGYTVIGGGMQGFPFPGGLLYQIHQLKMLGKSYERELDQYIWETIGRM